MPLVRIAFLEGKPPEFGRQIADVVYRTMVDVMNVPQKDNFQIISQHSKDSLIYDPAYLDIERSDGIIFIQITLNEGRSVEVKQAFYAAIVQRLNQELGIRREDVLINLVEVKKENWSFGNGTAQYAQ